MNKKLIIACIILVILLIIGVAVVYLNNSSNNQTASNTNQSSSTVNIPNNQPPSTTFNSKLFKNLSIQFQVSRYGDISSRVIDVGQQFNTGKGEIVEFSNSPIKLALNAMNSDACTDLKDVESNSKVTQVTSFKATSKNGKEVTITKFMNSDTTLVYYSGTYNEINNAAGTITMQYCTNFINDTPAIVSSMISLIQSTNLDLTVKN